MTDEGSNDAISFGFVGFVGIVRGKSEVGTMGMHVLRFPEIVMSRADADEDDRTIIEMIRYLCASERPVEDGHVIADEKGSRFQVQHEFPDQSSAPEPMRNPYGRLHMVSFKNIAEQN